MKFILMIFFQSAAISFCLAQQSFSSDHISKTDYLHKSRVNQNTGWIVLGAGLLTLGCGAIWVSSSDFLEADWNNAPYITTTIGIGVTAASIPLFIIAGNQSRLAASTSIHFSVQERDNRSIKMSGTRSLYPAILLKYHIK